MVVWGEPRVRTDLAVAARAAHRDARRRAGARWATWPTSSIVPPPNEIKREGASRRIDVTCNVEGRDLGSVAREIEARVRGAAFPAATTRSSWASTPRARRRSQRLLWLSALWRWSASCCCCTSISSRSALTVLLVRSRCRSPWSAAWSAAFLGGGVLSLGSLVGFVTVLGHRGAQRHHAGQPLPPPGGGRGEPFGPELVLRGAEERLAPILMTALATGAGPAAVS